MGSVRVAIVGACASGKSSIVDGLRVAGYDAYSVAQEHSIVQDLWRHLNPDFLVYLDVNLESVRKRRNNPNWPAWLYDVQMERLGPAKRRADIVVNTVDQGPNEVVRQVTIKLAEIKD